MANQRRPAEAGTRGPAANSSAARARGRAGGGVRPGRQLNARDDAPAWGHVPEWIAWGAAIAVLAVCVAITLGPHSIGDYFTETDFYGDYARGATLIQGGLLVPSRYHVIGPGYELALAAWGLVFHDLFRAAQFLSAVSAAATLVLWFYLLRRYVGPVSAVAATLLCAANPTFLQFGYSATTDAFSVALQALALCLLLARRGPGVVLAAGLIAAGAFLTRYTAGYLLPVGLVAIAGDDCFRGRRLRLGLLFVAGFALPTVAWIVFAWGHGDRPSSELHHLIAFEAFARARGMTWDAYQRDLQPRFHNLLDVIRYDPAALAGHMLRNLWEHARLDAQRLLGTAVAVCAGTGIVLAILDRRLRRAWPLALAGLAGYLVLVPARYGERYSLMVLPAYLMFAGIAFGSRLFAFPRGRANRVWIKPFLVVMPVMISLVASAQTQAKLLGQLPREVLESGRVLRALKRPGDAVIARKPHIAYVGQVASLPLPFAGALGELGAYARRTHARWLYFSYPEAESRPDLYPLLDTTGVIPGLTPRCVTTRGAGVLYEIGPAFGPGTRWIQDPRTMNLRVARARLALVPDDVEAMWLEAAMELSAGQWDRARRTLEQATLVNGRSRDALEAVGARDSLRAVGELGRLLATLAPGGRPPAPGGPGEPPSVTAP